MARTICIPLTSTLEARLKTQADARGSRTLDEAALAILTEALARPPQIPDDPRALDAELLKGLAGPRRTMTAADWDRKKGDLAARHPPE
jgi:hypothetical protein